MPILQTLHLEGLGQRLHDVTADVVHRALFDEGLEEPSANRSAAACLHIPLKLAKRSLE
jgi:hypothetical protein